MAYAFALGAGLCYAIASVFQHKVAAAAPSHLSMSPRLILEVVRHPMWLFGIGLDIGAYFLEAAALANGSIVLVQTLLVSGLLFALPLSAIGRETRPRRNDWFAAAAVAGGIAVFLAVGDPNAGHTRATALDWVLAFSFCGSIMVTMVIVTRNARPHYRALGLAVATGASYACTAALTKQVVGIIEHHGFDGLFTRWPVYALAVFSVVGLVLNQSAFNAGHLAASLPALAVTNPILSSILGVGLFEESLAAHGILQYAITAAAVVVMLGGVIRLARSPFVTGEDGDGHPAITPAAP
ncbi:MAG: DMT family transporter [Acidimicrobiia bacterium]